MIKCRAATPEKVSSNSSHSIMFIFGHLGKFMNMFILPATCYMFFYMGEFNIKPSRKGDMPLNKDIKPILFCSYVRISERIFSL